MLRGRTILGCCRSYPYIKDDNINEAALDKLKWVMLCAGVPPKLYAALLGEEEHNSRSNSSRIQCPPISIPVSQISKDVYSQSCAWSCWTRSTPVPATAVEFSASPSLHRYKLDRCSQSCTGTGHCWGKRTTTVPATKAVEFRASPTLYQYITNFHLRTCTATAVAWICWRRASTVSTAAAVNLKPVSESVPWRNVPERIHSRWTLRLP
jgi:hypothetical protein